MTRLDLKPGVIDTTTPNVARIYDYLLGGKDNFAADREAGDQLIAAIPDITSTVRDNRAFIQRVVRYLVSEVGIRQFLDLGAGLPTQANVHEIAQRIAPDVRVVYVDYDPVVWSHGQALLASNPRVTMVLGDLRRPAEVMQQAQEQQALDLTQPLGLLCACALHFIPDEDGPREIVAGYRDGMVSGSYLAMTHGPAADAPEEDPNGDIESATGVFSKASAQLHLRPVAEIRRLFDGFDILDPGVVWMNDWRPDIDNPPATQRGTLRAAVGRKP
jgi:hypothetical protein